MTQKEPAVELDYPHPFFDNSPSLVKDTPSFLSEPWVEEDLEEEERERFLQLEELESSSWRRSKESWEDLETRLVSSDNSWLKMDLEEPSESLYRPELFLQERQR